jgi:hypothetical protein
LETTTPNSKQQQQLALLQQIAESIEDDEATPATDTALDR